MSGKQGRDLWVEQQHRTDQFWHCFVKTFFRPASGMSWPYMSMLGKELLLTGIDMRQHDAAMDLQLLFVHC